MQVAITFDSGTGKTKAAAEQMGDIARGRGHAVTVTSIDHADPAVVSDADVIVVGSWTKGLFIIAQAPTEASMEFIDRLGPLEGKPAAVFTTYDIAVGGMLRKMAKRLRERDAQVTGMFKSKGPKAATGFGEWLAALENADAARTN